MKQPELVRTPTSAMVTDSFIKENYEVAAGVKQQLEADARYVRDFVEDVNASGFVAKALERHQQTAAVAPPGDAK